MKKFYALMAWTAVLLLWGSAATVYVSPSGLLRVCSLAGLGFPFFVAAVLVVAVVGLLAKTRLVAIPLVGLLGCFGSLRDYCPVNISSPPPKGCLKVLTYNTFGFGGWKLNDKGELDVVRYICEENPDIATLQEASCENEKKRETIKEQLHRYGYHYAMADSATIPVSIVSRWPVARSEFVFRNNSNSAVAFYVVPRRGDTLIVVSAHLQSMQLTTSDRQNYHEIVRNPDEAEAVKGKRLLLSKIANAGPLRAAQADTLAAFIDLHKGEKMIVMGDFNDTPISYAHHKVCSRLTDVYRATGNGIGRSFNRDAIYVRIDNIFCSSHFKPFAARVQEEVTFSDHYPIVAYLKEK